MACRRGTLSTMCFSLRLPSTAMLIWNIPRYQPFLIERYLSGDVPITFLKTREK